MKLYLFIDNWIHSFIYTGESKPGAVFWCDKKVSKWGLGWKDVAGGNAIILLMLGNESSVHSLIGLSTLELQGIDNKTIVLVVEERLPKLDWSITYGLILDLAKLRMDLYASLTKKGYLFSWRTGRCGLLSTFRSSGTR